MINKVLNAKKRVSSVCFIPKNVRYKSIHFLFLVYQLKNMNVFETVQTLLLRDFLNLKLLFLLLLKNLKTVFCKKIVETL